MQEKHVFPVPRATPEMVALMTSGLTASLALEQTGGMRRLAGRLYQGAAATRLLPASAAANMHARCWLH